MKQCCNNFKWQFIQDVQKARGCEFTYGICKNCGSHLIHLFYTATIHEGTYEIVGTEFISQMRNQKETDLKAFMQQWYDSLEPE